MLMRMYEKRLKGYKAIGYSVMEAERNMGFDAEAVAKEMEKP